MKKNNDKQPVPTACPFCGKEMIVKKSVYGKFYIVHKEEKVRQTLDLVCPFIQSEKYDTPEIAVSQWNTRKG